MLQAFENVVAGVLDQLEKDEIRNEENKIDYDALAKMVKERVGNFTEWKATKLHLKGVGEAVKGLEIRMEAPLPRGNTLHGPFRLVSNPVHAARHLRTHFGDVASHNQYRVIRAALAKSGLNHTDDVRETLRKYIDEDQYDIIEEKLFHNSNWVPA